LCLTVDSPDSGVRDRRFANRQVWGERTNGSMRMPGERASERQRHLAGLTWDDVAWIRAHTKLPMVMKGLLSPLDAELAVQHGMDVVYVSNHGGRRQDQLPATIEILPRVLEAVNGGAEVVVD